jgi:hypothetical protein
MTSDDQPQRPNEASVRDTLVSLDSERRHSSFSMLVPYRRPAANHTELPINVAATMAAVGSRRTLAKRRLSQIPRTRRRGSVRASA